MPYKDPEKRKELSRIRNKRWRATHKFIKIGEKGEIDILDYTKLEDWHRLEFRDIYHLKYEASHSTEMNPNQGIDLTEKEKKDAKLCYACQTNVLKKLLKRKAVYQTKRNTIRNPANIPNVIGTTISFGYK